MPVNKDKGQSSGGKPEEGRTAIAGDAAKTLARESRELAGVAGTAAGAWWRGIADWFRFVHNRRLDTRFPVFPPLFRIAEILAIAASAVALLVLIADPLLVRAMASPGWQPGGVFETVTWFGKTDWILYPTGLALIAFSLWQRGWIGRRAGFRWHSIMLAVYYLFTSIAFSGLIAMALKNLIGRARPPFLDGSGMWESFPLRDAYDFASFPSGHATTAGALAVALALLFPRLRVFFLLAGVWIAASRPALGVHFFSDILAGFSFGTAFSYYYARSFARKRLLFAFDDEGRLQLSRRQAAFVPRQLRESD